MAGFLGAFTTFSTYSLDAFAELWERGALRRLGLCAGLGRAVADGCCWPGWPWGGGCRHERGADADRGAEEGDQRLDRWLKRQFPQLSQGAVEKMCRKGELRVDGGRVKAATPAGGRPGGAHPAAARRRRPRARAEGGRSPRRMPR
jgi:hypothetical protein